MINVVILYHALSRNFVIATLIIDNENQIKVDSTYIKF